MSIGRFKYKISPPATTGISEDFDRIFRVQENTIEQVAMFLPALWVFSFFVSPAIATGAGAVWLVGRVMYASGYYKKAAARGAGFGVSSLASNFLIAGERRALAAQWITPGRLFDVFVGCMCVLNASLAPVHHLCWQALQLASSRASLACERISSPFLALYAKRFKPTNSIRTCFEGVDEQGGASGLLRGDRLSAPAPLVANI